jgi:hypothetical protein
MEAHELKLEDGSRELGDGRRDETLTEVSGN